MSTLQFDRIAVLNVFKRQQLDKADGSTSLKNIDTNGTQFSSRMPDGSAGFRIKFTVQKATGPVLTGHQCTIQIYNVGADSRAMLSKINNLVVLQAGYGNNPQNIFQGNILSGKTKKEGPDYITEIEVMDGLFAHQNSMINLSFNKGVSQLSIINQMVGSLKDAGVIPGVILGVPNSPYNQGVVYSGKTVDKIKEICDKNELNFTIEDQCANIVPYGSAKSETIIALDENTGLIGIPEIESLTSVSSAIAIENNASDSSQAKAPRISFKALLNPQIGCHQKVSIKSKFLSGVYITTLVTHVGDSSGGEWYTNGEAT